MTALADRFPGMYGKWGFRDSVNVQTGTVSGSYLSLDQGMIMAALGNALGERHAAQGVRRAGHGGCTATRDRDRAVRGFGGRALEHHRRVAVAQHAVLAVRLDGAREHGSLDVGAEPGERRHVVAV